MGDEPSTRESRPDRFPIALVYAALVLLGVALGVWGAFLVPLRLPGGLEGLADVVAFGGNLGAGWAAGRLLRDVPAAAMPGIGWLVTVLAVGSIARPADEAVLPGKLVGDPGIVVVSNLFLLAGAVGAVVAVLLAGRFTRVARQPTSKQ